MDSLDIVVFSDSHGNSGRMRDVIDGTGADVVMYGHTHEPDDRFIPGEDGKMPLRILNPGSIGDRIHPTYATITLRGQDILTNICDYEGEY